ncbi:hypothetical protein [Leptospira adleri]|uniref:Uncharacterized protein n=1 Tax=Leptospira adleri TaxID=2023186 RepID=A0A2M9YSJ0_9LEPT|nr:hypothetical protein [Leptospira adleri]PJZ54501.1 hypothetical protein CH380_05405 [Leptospira adleri]PJZ61159.1 hypothetical protein CH376_14550 [Leptospira adleri]
MKFTFVILFLLVVYLSVYFSLTISNLWILISTFSVVHIGLFQAYRERLSLKFYLLCSLIHLFSILLMNLYFRQS